MRSARCDLRDAICAMRGARYVFAAELLEPCIDAALPLAPEPTPQLQAWAGVDLAFTAGGGPPGNWRELRRSVVTTRRVVKADRV